MIRKEEYALVTISNNPRGGIGEIIGKQLILESDMENNLNGIYVNYLDINSEIGYHEHHDEDEIYSILDGIGIANDNGVEFEISSGSVLYTKAGSGHALRNTGNKALKFLAFMIKHDKTLKI